MCLEFAEEVASARWCSDDERYRVRRTFFFFQAEDGIRDRTVTGVQTCALPIWVANMPGAYPRPVEKPTHPASIASRTQTLIAATSSSVAGVKRSPITASRIDPRSEEHTSELQSPYDLVCRLLLEKKKTAAPTPTIASLPPLSPRTSASPCLSPPSSCRTASPTSKTPLPIPLRSATTP